MSDGRAAFPPTPRDEDLPPLSNGWKRKTGFGSVARVNAGEPTDAASSKGKGEAGFGKFAANFFGIKGPVSDERAGKGSADGPEGGGSGGKVALAGRDGLPSPLKQMRGQVMPGPPTPRIPGGGGSSTAGGGRYAKAEARKLAIGEQKALDQRRIQAVRNGGLLTKYPFGNSKPKVRFFQVVNNDTEVTWGEPKDAGRLPGKMRLSDVDAIVRGRRTKCVRHPPAAALDAGAGTHNPSCLPLAQDLPQARA
mmetsp:Transcript_45871/g.146427  ORF Transcript_45871/g.146427 Transcript_45871/m.146427 type:complete len:251 (-) Transcript_45871:209-961(-)